MIASNMKIFALLISSMAGISFSGHAHSCNVHTSQHWGPHGGCDTVSSTVLSSQTGVHFFGEWDSFADLDLSATLPNGQIVDGSNYFVPFNNNNALGRHAGDANGALSVPGANGTPLECVISGVGAQSCEQISTFGDILSGTYTAKLNSFGNNGIFAGDYEITPVVTGGAYAIYNTHSPTLTVRGRLNNQGENSDILSIDIVNPQLAGGSHSVGVDFSGIYRLPDTLYENQIKHIVNNDYISESRKLLDGLRTGHASLEESLYYFKHYRGNGSTSKCIYDGKACKDNEFGDHTYNRPPPIAVDASKLDLVIKSPLGAPYVVDYKNSYGYEIEYNPHVLSVSGQSDIFTNYSYDASVHGRVPISENTGGIYDSSFEYNPATSGFLLEKRNEVTKKTAERLGISDLTDEPGFIIKYVGKPSTINYITGSYSAPVSYSDGGASDRSFDIDLIKDSIPMFSTNTEKYYFNKEFFDR